MSIVRGTAGRTFASLRSHNVRWFLGGATVSYVGNWIQMVSFPWLVLEITGNGTALGLTYAVQFVPILVLGPLGGLVADRFDKRRLQIVTSALLGVLTLAIGVLTLTGAVNLVWIIGISLGIGVVSAVDNPARRAFIVELADPAETTNAVNLLNAATTLARISGPAIAGVCIATVGIGWSFIINGASFAAVIVSMLALHTGEIRRPPPIARTKGATLAGIVYSWRDRAIRTTLVMVLVVGSLAFNYQVILPLFTKRTFGAGAGALAILFACNGVGALLGALLTAHRARASTWTLMMATLALGVTLLATAAAPGLGVAYVTVTVMGAAAMVFLGSGASIVHERVRPEFRGRVSALFGVCFLGSTPIGSPIVGAVSQNFGPRAGLALGAVTALGAGAIGLLVLRRWRTTGAVGDGPDAVIDIVDGEEPDRPEPDRPEPDRPAPDPARIAP